MTATVYQVIFHQKIFVLSQRAHRQQTRRSKFAQDVQLLLVPSFEVKILVLLQCNNMLVLAIQILAENLACDRDHAIYRAVRIVESCK